MTDSPRQIALITGGSRGIGRATALRLARLGMLVIVGYHANKAAAEETVAALQGEGHVACRISIEDADSIAQARDFVAGQFGRLDVLVNSGGRTKPVPLNDLDGLDDALFDSIVQVNLRGPFSVIRAFRSLMEKSGDAVIVNVSSIAAKTGVGSNLAYCAAKGGLDTLTTGLAKVLGPTIRVFSVSPAGVDTDFVAGRSRAQLEAMADKTPLRKVTSPEDVALAIEGAITHLTSSTGIALIVDEGRHL
ncbi:MAG: SDR family oxidoreductase [Mameliella sp.]|nr:SDR family oxidoreductase [Mameliella sp.]